MKKLRRILLLIVLSVPLPALADAAADRGEAVVEQWCRFCHRHASDPPDPVMAPPFEELVERKGRDWTYLWRFLHEDHFPMTTYRLHENEKADVVEYLLSLQKAQR